MGDQQACRKADEQVAGAGHGVRARQWPRVAGCGKTDRLVAWREDRFSRQVFE